MNKEDAYNPQEKQKEILSRGLEIIGSVQYKVSARWLFYRLFQEGFYLDKGDYKNKYIPTISRARHAFYNGWNPYILEDSTRACIWNGLGWSDVEKWIKNLSEKTCNLDKWVNQDYYIECWFEARAMTAQFEHYTEFVNLRPMGGQPSIPFKYETAQDLSSVSRSYGNPIVILYFGDCDNAGEIISQTIERDVRKWAGVPFDFIYCGLTSEQASEYDVPENPEKPGQFQWEALLDQGAKEIITESMEPYINQDCLSETQQSEEEAEEWISEKLTGLIDDWNER